MKKIYYINQADLIDDQNIEGHTGKIMCLFSEKTWEGKGNFCGWYGVEFYNNAHIIAYCAGERTVDNIKPTDIFFDSVIIFSCIVEHKIEAEDDAEAIEIFKTLVKNNELKHKY